MKLSRIYSNRSENFSPVDFQDGLNIILAQRIVDNAHNLGKSTLGELIDFCLLRDIDAKFFLKRESVFKDFIFFLEIKLEENQYITIKRSVEEPSKIYLNFHNEGAQNFSELKDEEWSHSHVAFDRAKEILCAHLQWDINEPGGYRKLLHYVIRRQDDYVDVAKVVSFAQGKHKYWKPFVAGILGFNDEQILELYEKRDEEAQNIAYLESYREIIKTEKADEEYAFSERLKEIDDEIAQLSESIKSLKFVVIQNKEQEKKLGFLQSEILKVQKRLYTLKVEAKQINDSLETDIEKSRIKEMKSLFEEVKVNFPDSIEKDFEDLLKFRKAITKERDVYLKRTLQEINKDIESYGNVLIELEHRYNETAAFIRENGVNEKCSKATQRIVQLQTEAVEIKNKLVYIEKKKAKEAQEKKIKADIDSLKVAVKQDVHKQDGNKESLYCQIRNDFASFINQVLGRTARFSVSVNKEGNLEFETVFLADDGKTTLEDYGSSFRKIMCVAFDLAVLKSHIQTKFPRFVYHDGIFESIDDNVKRRLRDKLYEYSQIGIQQIVTLINSDLPDEEFFKNKGKIVLRLHDAADNSGRLFKKMRY